MTQADYITRKEMVELSSLLTYDRVRRHEKEWGLDKCRVPSFSRPFYYIRVRVVTRLTRLGILVAVNGQLQPSRPDVTR